MSDIKLIVLSNGDKVIGQVCESENTNLIILKNSFILKEIMTEQGFSIIPMPLVQTSDEIVNINPNSIVVYPCEPKEELMDMYRQLTSNIIIPKNNSGIKLVK